MNALVLRLMNGLAAVQDSDVVEPELEVQEGEEIIGEITEIDLRKLFIFFNRVKAEYVQKREAVVILTDHDHTRECSRCAMSAEIIVEKGFSDGVEKLFWTALKKTLTIESRFKVIAGSGVRISKGWKIVAVRPINLAELCLCGFGGKTKPKPKGKKKE